MGDTLWTTTFGLRGRCVRQTSDGGYIFVGGTGVGGNEDVWLGKYNALGDTIWTKTYGAGLREWAASVRQTSDGGYIITGTLTRHGTTDHDIFLIKTAPDPSIANHNNRSSK